MIYGHFWILFYCFLGLLGLKDNKKFIIIIIIIIVITNYYLNQKPNVRFKAYILSLVKHFGTVNIENFRKISDIFKIRTRTLVGYVYFYSVLGIFNFFDFFHDVSQ